MTDPPGFWFGDSVGDTAHLGEGKFRGWSLWVVLLETSSEKLSKPEAVWGENRERRVCPTW